MSWRASSSRTAFPTLPRLVSAPASGMFTRQGAGTAGTGVPEVRWQLGMEGSSDDVSSGPVAPAPGSKQKIDVQALKGKETIS